MEHWALGGREGGQQFLAPSSCMVETLQADMPLHGTELETWRVEVPVACVQGGRRAVVPPFSYGSVVS